MRGRAVLAALFLLGVTWAGVAAQRFGDGEVVLGRSGVDGMCRPLGYQGFVFVGGRFAGTLAPPTRSAARRG